MKPVEDYSSAGTYFSPKVVGTESGRRSKTSGGKMRLHDDFEPDYKKHRQAIYAMSGDPIHNGHIDTITRAAGQFDKVYAAIGKNPNKNPAFTIEERVAMAKTALRGVDNVEVISFSGMLSDYAYENCISTIVKGVRNSSDTPYEQMLDQVIKSQSLGIETMILHSDPTLSHISSSAVKAIQKEQGCIRDYVPMSVKQSVEERISGQYVIGLTGVPGAGKSYVGKKFEEWGLANGVSVHNIEIDEIGHDIIGSLSLPRYDKIRRDIIAHYGQEVADYSGPLGTVRVNRKALSKIVFDNPDEMKWLVELCKVPTGVRIRREMQGKKGIIVLNSALISEMGFGWMCNNNVGLVTVDDTSQRRRLDARGYSAAHTQNMMGSQYLSGEKQKVLEEHISKAGHGQVWEIPNNDGMIEYEKVFEEIVKDLGVK